MQWINVIGYQFWDYKPQRLLQDKPEYAWIKYHETTVCIYLYIVIGGFLKQFFAHTYGGPLIFAMDLRRLYISLWNQPYIYIFNHHIADEIRITGTYVPNNVRII